MYKPLTMGTLITFVMLVGCIAGCGNSDDDPAEKVDEPVKINLLATSPENGGTVPATGDLRIVFDSSPESVTVDGKPAIILNNTAFVTITDLPNVIPGTEKTVIIEWRNPDNSVAGAKTITFTVLKLVADLPQSDDDDVGTSDATTVVVSPAAGAIIPSNQQFTLTFDQDVAAVTVNGTAASGWGLNWRARPASNQQFTLTFDQDVAAVTVNGTAASGLGLNWRARPALVEGLVTLVIEWTNRSGSTGSKAVGPYLVRDPGDDDAGPPDATMVVVSPAAGAIIPSNQQFTLTFDQGVTAAVVNRTPATGSGLNWRAWPALVEGLVTLVIEWTNRSGSAGSKAVGPYLVRDPDTTAPAIVSGTVANGDVDVDPAPINAGGFRFDFDEAVTGSVKLTDEASADLNWIANVARQTATLTAVAGQELANETTYKIEIDVKDGASNRTRKTITFVTEVKE